MTKQKKSKEKGGGEKENKEKENKEKEKEKENPSRSSSPAPTTTNNNKEIKISNQSSSPLLHPRTPSPLSRPRTETSPAIASQSLLSPSTSPSLNASSSPPKPRRKGRPISVMGVKREKDKDKEREDREGKEDGKAKKKSLKKLGVAKRHFSKDKSGKDGGLESGKESKEGEEELFLVSSGEYFHKTEGKEKEGKEEDNNSRASSEDTFALSPPSSTTTTTTTTTTTSTTTSSSTTNTTITIPSTNSPDFLSVNHPNSRKSSSRSSSPRSFSPASSPRTSPRTSPRSSPHRLSPPRQSSPLSPPRSPTSLSHPHSSSHQSSRPQFRRRSSVVSPNPKQHYDDLTSQQQQQQLVHQLHKNHILHLQSSSVVGGGVGGGMGGGGGRKRTNTAVEDKVHQQQQIHQQKTTPKKGVLRQQGGKDIVTTVCWLSDKSLLVGLNTGWLELWEPLYPFGCAESQWARRCAEKFHEDEITCCYVSSDCPENLFDHMKDKEDKEKEKDFFLNIMGGGLGGEGWIVTGCRDGSVTAVCCEQKFRIDFTHNSPVLAVEIFKSGEFLVTLTEKFITIWSLPSGQQFATSPLLSLFSCFSPPTSPTISHAQSPPPSIPSLSPSPSATSKASFPPQASNSPTSSPSRSPPPSPSPLSSSNPYSNPSPSPSPPPSPSFSTLPPPSLSLSSYSPVSFPTNYSIFVPPHQSDQILISGGGVMGIWEWKKKKAMVQPLKDKKQGAEKEKEKDKDKDKDKDREREKEEESFSPIPILSCTTFLSPSPHHKGGTEGGMVIGGTEEGEVGGWEVGRGGGWRGFERVVEGDGVVGLEVCPDQTKICAIYASGKIQIFSESGKYLSTSSTSPNTTRVKWSLDGSLITFYGGSSVVVWAVESEEFALLNLFTRFDNESAVALCISSFPTAALNFSSLTHESPLFQACRTGNLTILEALVSAGTSVFVCNRFGVTPLHVAARENRRELVRRLVDLGADVEAIDENGQRPLHYASVISEDMCDLLIDLGSSVNSPDFNGETPLHVAVTADAADCVVALLDHGANPLALNSNMHTPLSLQSKLTRSSAKKYLQKISLIWEGKGELESVSLAGCKLKRVPKIVFELAPLKKLDLSFNLLDSLPTSLASLTNLKQIKLESNPLSSLPLFDEKKHDLLPFLSALPSATSPSPPSLRLFLLSRAPRRFLYHLSLRVKLKQQIINNNNNNDKFVTHTCKNMISIGSRAGGGEKEGERGGGGPGSMVVWSFCPKLRGGGGDRLFYCARAVYVVPVDLIEGGLGENRLGELTKSVQNVYNSIQGILKPIVVVVGSHTNHSTGEAEEEELRSFGKSYWGKTTHIIFIRVGEWSFVDQLLSLTDKSALLYPEISLGVVYLKKKIENMRAEYKYLERRQFERLAKEAGITSTKLQKAEDYLTQVGTMIPLPSSTSFLPNYYIIDYEWFASQIVNLFMEHSSLKKEGEGGEPGKRGMFGGFIMSVREIYRVMREYPKGLCDGIINLIIQKETAYLFPSWSQLCESFSHIPPPPPPLHPLHRLLHCLSSEESPSLSFAFHDKALLFPRFTPTAPTTTTTTNNNPVATTPITPANTTTNTNNNNQNSWADDPLEVISDTPLARVIPYHREWRFNTAPPLFFERLLSQLFHLPRSFLLSITNTTAMLYGKKQKKCGSKEVKTRGLATSCMPSFGERDSFSSSAPFTPSASLSPSLAPSTTKYNLFTAKKSENHQHQPHQHNQRATQTFKKLTGMVSQKYSHPNPKSDRQEELKLGGEEREEGDGKEGKKGGFAKEDYSSFTWLKFDRKKMIFSITHWHDSKHIRDDYYVALLVTVDSLIDTLYKSAELERLIGCRYAIYPKHAPHLFTYEECSEKIHALEPSPLICPINNCLMDVSFVAPDISFRDVHQINQKDVDDDRGFIAEGGSGKVSKAFLHTKSHLVASKTFKKLIHPQKLVKCVREIYIMSLLNHPNIVIFEGVTIKPFKLLLELCDGDLGFLLCADDLAELITDTDCGRGLRFPKGEIVSLCPEERKKRLQKQEEETENEDEKETGKKQKKEKGKENDKEKAKKVKRAKKEKAKEKPKKKGKEKKKDDEDGIEIEVVIEKEEHEQQQSKRSRRRSSPNASPSSSSPSPSLTSASSNSFTSSPVSTPPLHSSNSEEKGKEETEENQEKEEKEDNEEDREKVGNEEKENNKEEGEEAGEEEEQEGDEGVVMGKVQGFPEKIRFPRENLRFFPPALSDEELPTLLRLRIAYDITQGLCFMHELSPPLVHRDFRPPNILIVSRDPKAPIVAKIADFGLTIQNLPPSGGELRTWQWLAPEVLDTAQRFYDEKSDIFSLGMVLYELFTRLPPYSPSTVPPQYIRQGEMVDAKLCETAILEEDLRPSLPSSLSADICSLIEACWERDPKKRPSAKILLVFMKKLLLEEWKKNRPSTSLSFFSLFSSSYGDSEGFFEDIKGGTLKISSLGIIAQKEKGFGRLILAFPPSSGDIKWWVGSSKGEVTEAILGETKEVTHKPLLKTHNNRIVSLFYQKEKQLTSSKIIIFSVDEKLEIFKWDRKGNFLKTKECPSSIIPTFLPFNSFSHLYKSKSETPSPFSIIATPSEDFSTFQIKELPPFSSSSSSSPPSPTVFCQVPQPPVSLCPTQEGRVWVGGRRGMIVVFSLHSREILRQWTAHDGAVVSSLLYISQEKTKDEDLTSEIWSTGEDGCLYIWREHDFHLVDILSGVLGVAQPRYYTVLAKGSEGRVYVGTYFGQVVVFDSQKRTVLEMIGLFTTVEVTALQVTTKDNKDFILCCYRDRRIEVFECFFVSSSHTSLAISS